MVTTVPKAFEQFIKSLIPTEKENESIINRHEYIRKTLSGKVINDKRKPHFLTGSYKRHTQIRPVNDVDIMIILDYYEYWDQFGNDPIALLRFIKQKLKETYPETNIIIQSHSIGLKFSKIPDVDIIPSFLIDEENEIYIIPDKNFSIYIKTSPPKHQTIISEHNLKLKNKFIPLIRIIKKWKSSNDIDLKSFHLEIFIMKLITSPFQRYQDALHHFFESATKAIYDSCMDPAGLSGDLADYLTTQDKQNLSKEFLKLSQKIKELNQLEKEGYHQPSIEGWYNIFKEPFPRPIKTSGGKYQSKKSTEFPPEGKNITFGYKKW